MTCERGSVAGSRRPRRHSRVPHHCQGGTAVECAWRAWIGGLKGMWRRFVSLYKNIGATGMCYSYNSIGDQIVTQQMEWEENLVILRARKPRSTVRDRA